MDTIFENLLKLKQDEAGIYLYALLREAGLHPQREVFYHSASGEFLVGLTAAALAIILFFGALKRRVWWVIIPAFAIPLLLLLEFSLDIPAARWPVLKKNENIIVQFPVQNMSQRVVVGAPCNYSEEPPEEPTRIEATLSGFLLPAAIVLCILGAWRMVLYFGKLNSEDARTIMLVVGGIFACYFVTLAAVSFSASNDGKRNKNQIFNADSLAALSELALNLGERDIRLENTSVIIAFFGGSQGEGAKALARRLAKKGNALETMFIECRGIGREKTVIMISAEEQGNVHFSGRRLAQLFTTAASTETGRPPEVVLTDASVLGEFALRGYPSITLTSVSETGKSFDAGSDGTNRARLQSLLRTMETMLLKIDTDQLREQMPSLEENTQLSR
jgi:hypothetical protein